MSEVTGSEVASRSMESGPEDLASKKFKWGTVTHGDCTMFEGANWTLYSNGTAHLDATVTSSDDDDAWIIHRAEIQDKNHAVLGTLSNSYPADYNDTNKFVQNMPSSSEQYKFFADGTFDRNLFGLIYNMTMWQSC